MRALGADSGISKSQVSRICADLDTEVSAFRDRSLAGQMFPYIFVDATYCKARVNRRVVAQAVVVATGVCGDGRREVLGFAVGDSDLVVSDIRTETQQSCLQVKSFGISPSSQERLDQNREQVPLPRHPP